MAVAELEQQRAAMAHTVGNLKAEQLAAVDEWRQQLDRKERELTRQRRKVRELITAAAEQQARHQLQTQELQGDLDRLSRNTVRWAAGQLGGWRWNEHQRGHSSTVSSPSHHFCLGVST